jgi:hypothetical protein
MRKHLVEVVSVRMPEYRDEGVNVKDVPYNTGIEVLYVPSRSV